MALPWPWIGIWSTYIVGIFYFDNTSLLAVVVLNSLPVISSCHILLGKDIAAVATVHSFVASSLKRVSSPDNCSPAEKLCKSVFFLYNLYCRVFMLLLLKEIPCPIIFSCWEIAKWEGNYFAWEREGRMIKYLQKNMLFFVCRMRRRKKICSPIAMQNRGTNKGRHNMREAWGKIRW